MDQTLPSPAKRVLSLRLLLKGTFFLLITAWVSFDLARTLWYGLDHWGTKALVDPLLYLRTGEVIAFAALAGSLSGLLPGHLRNWAGWLLLAGGLLSGFSAWLLQGRMVIWMPGLASAGVMLLAGLALVLRAAWISQRLRRVSLGVFLFLLLLIRLAGYSMAFLSLGYAVVPYPAPPPPHTEDRDERWRQDIRALGDGLARLHKNAYHTLSQDAFSARLAALEAGVSGWSDAEIILEMMRFTAAIGDGHTEFPIQQAAGFHAYPLALRWYEDGLYVIAGAPAYRGLLGARILRLGNLSAEAAYQAVLPYISHENDAWARHVSRNHLVTAEILKAVGAIDAVGPLPVQGERDGQAVSVEVLPLAPGEQVDYELVQTKTAFYRSRPDEPFWFEVYPEAKTLYFRYASCVDILGFRTEMSALWRAVDENEIERLIVDLRGNGGGNSMQFDWFFLPGLKDRPHLDDPERLFVLIDQGTFSSASDNAVTMRLDTRATLAGQATGGKPNSYGEVRTLRLPNSRLRFSYSTNYFETLPGSDPPALLPDLEIPLKAEDAFQGNDPVLERLAPEVGWEED